MTNDTYDHDSTDSVAITTGLAARGRPLSVGLAMAVLAATLLAGTGGALAAPTDAEPTAVRMESSTAAQLADEHLADAPDLDAAGLQIEVVETTEEYVAVEVWFPSGTFDEIKPAKDVFLGRADRFEVHEDGAAVSLPEETEGLARPVEVRSIEFDSDRFHGKLMYFRVADVAGYKVPDVTLGLGVFPESTVPAENFDAAGTERGLRAEVLETSEEYVAVGVTVPADVELAGDPGDPAVWHLGHADRFVVQEDGAAVSLPEDTEGLARPVAMDFGNPHDVLLYFRTEDIDLSGAEGEAVTLGLGVFPDGERTVPGDHWDTDTVSARSVAGHEGHWTPGFDDVDSRDPEQDR